MKKEKQINFKRRIQERNLTYPDGYVSFMAHPLSEKTLDELAVISEMLEKAGISLVVERYETETIGTGFDYVIFKTNVEQYEEVMTRHAGRKPNFAEKYDKYGKCTVAELQEKLGTISKTKLAEELGCPRMTLYRIIKNIEKMNPDGDMSIWHFTS